MSPFEKTAEENEELTSSELEALSRLAQEESFPIEEMIPEYGDA